MVNNYNFDNYLVHSFSELQWRSGVTYYDSILNARIKWPWLDSQMIDFNYIIETQALLNIEKKYWIWKFEVFDEYEKIKKFMI